MPTIPNLNVDAIYLIKIDSNNLILFILILFAIITLIISIRSSGIYKSLLGVSGIFFIGMALSIYGTVENNAMSYYNIILSYSLFTLFLLIGIALILVSASILLGHIGKLFEK